jgi:AcrR family transcriptional regulator
MTTTTDASMPTRLLEAAARLLSVDGPTALTTRRVAAEAGTSTMGVYTHFGSMSELASAVVAEGFRRLGERLRAVPRTDDALADLAGLVAAYRANAHANQPLYTVMFASASLGGFRRTSPEQLEVGRDTYDEFTDVIRRAIEAGQLAGKDPMLITSEVWAAMHGTLLLEFAGFFRDAVGPAVQYSLLRNALRGMHADPAALAAFKPAKPKARR